MENHYAGHFSLEKFGIFRFFFPKSVPVKFMAC